MDDEMFNYIDKYLKLHIYNDDEKINSEESKKQSKKQSESQQIEKNNSHNQNNQSKT